MENLVMFNFEFWKKKRVLITGHTGFKGTWLMIWLNLLGAEVYGISIDTLPNLSLFKEIEENKLCKNFFIDIRDEKKIKKVILEIKPEIVFHLAAQSLVRESYKNPLATWTTNLSGSLNLLDSLMPLKNICAVIMVTTDKVYKNREWEYGYRENDPLGGIDPYSSSKAACEIAISSWRSSFCGNNVNQSSTLAIASARSGNVIGGGDWAIDRIIPDTIHWLRDEKKLLIRNRNATRPWQHTLEPLSGYILLAEKLYKEQNTKKENESNIFSTSFNFGPYNTSNRTVQELINEIKKSWSSDRTIFYEKDIFHEAGLLNLQIDKAYRKLKWTPKWDFENTVSKTINWYKKFYENKSMAYKLCLDDIESYMK